MKVSGFTFLRNAVINGYPFEESIRSLLPIVDEYVIAVGLSDDDTLERVKSIEDPRIRILETVWNESMRDRGYVYGQQKMIAQYNCTGDWLFYLEGDEVLHENQYLNIKKTMQDNLFNLDVEALYFDFLHFYGTPNQFGIAGYRKAPRILRNNIRAIAPDGLFWVVMDANKRGRYPRAKYAGGTVYHYGHCRSIRKMEKKIKDVGKYWGNDDQKFDGYGNIDLAELRQFSGSHPRVMTNWIVNEAESQFAQSANYEITRKDLRNRFRFWLEEILGIEVSKKHYTSLD